MILEKPITVIALLIGIITGIATLLISYFNSKPPAPQKLPVMGFVKDKSTNKGINHAWLILNGQKDTIWATTSGGFQFELTVKPGSDFRILAGADGYHGFNKYVKAEAAIDIFLDPEN